MSPLGRGNGYIGVAPGKARADRSRCSSRASTRLQAVTRRQRLLRGTLSPCGVEATLALPPLGAASARLYRSSLTSHLPLLPGIARRPFLPCADCPPLATSHHETATNAVSFRCSRSITARGARKRMSSKAGERNAPPVLPTTNRCQLSAHHRRRYRRASACSGIAKCPYVAVARTQRRRASDHRASRPSAIATMRRRLPTPTQDCRLDDTRRETLRSPCTHTKPVPETPRRDSSRAWPRSTAAHRRESRPTARRQAMQAPPASVAAQEADHTAPATRRFSLRVNSHSS